MIEIEIDGKKLEVEPGSMLIEAADNAGIHIPRFCYHKKLSIAANCRMCLVDVEKMGKPMPACATPVTQGMKVSTLSEKAVDAQKSVMEFLLINHPLDCPICDQGGECELQDVAMGYGGDVSRYSEGKRVVKDKDIGPLIATDMTRCIHCTRCVRFGQEVAGMRELGATGRGEHTEIGTFIEHSMSSELSANAVDLCPVGALTAKPSRYTARAWELQQRSSISPHDCLGSNLSVHTRRGEVIRVVPKENEGINETWLSDRDRFSYQATRSDKRLQTPMVKRNGEWQATDWQTALDVVLSGLQKVQRCDGAQELGAIASPSSTLEEFYLLQKLMRGLGSNHIDHRVRRSDFSDQDQQPLYSSLGITLPGLEDVNAILLIGSNIRHEQPLAGLRVRKASLNGTQVMSINSVDYDFHFEQAQKAIVAPQHIPTYLLGLAKACAAVTHQQIPAEITSIFDGVTPTAEQQAMAERLHSSEKKVLLLGALAHQHPEAALLNSLAALIAKWTGAHLGAFSEGANSAGAWLAGAVPHRGVGGKRVVDEGLNALNQFKQGLKAYILLGVEPDKDCAYSFKALQALDKAEFVLAMTAFDTEVYREHADVMLPITPFTETSGTFVNIEGQWQSFVAAVPPRGESRPAWKILRVLGNLLDLTDFDYESSVEVRDAIHQELGEIRVQERSNWDLHKVDAQYAESEIVRINEWPVYRGDSLVRHADALQKSALNIKPALRINAALADKLSLSEGDMARVSQPDTQVILPVVIDSRVADNSALIASGFDETAKLATPFGPVNIVGVEQ